jgi:hypothetical protein
MKVATDLLGKLVSRVDHEAEVPVDTGIVRAVYVTQNGPMLLVEALTDYAGKPGDLSTWGLYSDGRISTTRHRYGAEEAYLKRQAPPYDQASERLRVRVCTAYYKHHGEWPKTLFVDDVIAALTAEAS